MYVEEEETCFVDFARSLFLMVPHSGSVNATSSEQSATYANKNIGYAQVMYQVPGSS